MDTLDLLSRLIAERVELPRDVVQPGVRLVDDLHLSSITVGQLMNQAAAELGFGPPAAATSYATATVAELAEVLSAIGRDASEPDGLRQEVIGAARWVRPFVTELVATARPAPQPGGTGAWRAFAPAGHPLAEPLRHALAQAGVGGGVLLCLPPDVDERHVELALAAARAALDGSADRFVVVQHGRGMSGLAKTLHLEAPAVRTTVVDVNPHTAVVAELIADVAATDGFAEVVYAEDGARRTPVLRPWRPRPSPVPHRLGPADVLLVTGGGKGITAECALALAADSGARLALLGRSDPVADAELAANLERFAAAGVGFRYVRADVTDAAAVGVAVAEVAAELGPVTAVLHGAGRNEPAALAGLDMAAFRGALAPKIDGLEAVLNAVDADRLRLLVTFGSIIGRAGLRGEAHYATANEWMADLTTRFGAEHPGCRAVCLEWSVWSGAGMGERLDVIESLMRDGITPMSVDDAIDVLRRVVAAPDLPPVLVVTGRVQDLPTIRFKPRELPLLRFVDRVLVDYPGVELVAETTLAPSTDLYLDDHELDGDLLLPAVLGMEAMAQIAHAATGHGGVLAISNAEFLRPIVVPRNGSTTIRVAAVVDPEGTGVELAIRSGDTGYAADHFRARLHYGVRMPTSRLPARTDAPAPATVPVPVALPMTPAAQVAMPAVRIEPGRDLYGDLLFQGKRFQRLVRYHRAGARCCSADLAGDNGTPWFSAFLPSRLLLGDPGLRDALMHGIQVCVPDATLLPAAVDRIWIASTATPIGEVTFRAVEQRRDGDTYRYDVEVMDGRTVVERWEGLRLRAVRKRDGAGPWVPPLLGPYLQRRLSELVDFAGVVVVEPDGDPTQRRQNTALALSRAFERPVTVRYRPDGRPEVSGGWFVSASHGAGVTLAIAGPGAMGCDIEAVVERDRGSWAGLLGGHLGVAVLLAAEAGEPLSTAATRVWAALEALQKVGQLPTTPLTPTGYLHGRWVTLAAGPWRVATLVTGLRDRAEPVVVAVALRAS